MNWYQCIYDYALFNNNISIKNKYASFSLNKIEKNTCYKVLNSPRQVNDTIFIISFISNKKLKMRWFYLFLLLLVVFSCLTITKIQTDISYSHLWLNELNCIVYLLRGITMRSESAKANSILSIPCKVIHV